MVGPYDRREGVRRCLSREELLAAGWRDTPRGWTFKPEMSQAEKDRLAARKHKNV
jgi:hypothetical protein